MSLVEHIQKIFSTLEEELTLIDNSPNLISPSYKFVNPKIVFIRVVLPDPDSSNNTNQTFFW